MHHIIAVEEGDFGADKAMACAIIEEAFFDVSTEILMGEHEDAEIKIKSEGEAHPFKGLYTPNSHFERSDKTKYGISGLVWNQYGDEVIIDYEKDKKEVDENLIQPIERNSWSGELSLNKAIDRISAPSIRRLLVAVGICKWFLRGELMD